MVYFTTRMRTQRLINGGTGRGLDDALFSYRNVRNMRLWILCYVWLIVALVKK